MDAAALKIQQEWKKKQARKKAKEGAPAEEAPKEEAKEEAPAEKGYDRDAEKNQEIGEEFLNPDEDMDAAALKIQQEWKKK